MPIVRNPNNNSIYAFNTNKGNVFEFKVNNSWRIKQTFVPNDNKKE